MAIRLLPKSEIDKAKALDRQREMDEGKKLAQKVDTLRKTHAEEETTLQNFRTQTLAQIQLEIDGEIGRLETVKREVQVKRDELLSLSAPLDKAWKYYVTTEKAEIAELKLDATNKSADLQRQLDQQALLSAETEQEKRFYLLGQQQNVADRVRAKKILDDADISASETRNKIAAVLQEAENKRLEAQQRLSSILDKEKAVALHEARLAKKEEELEIREMDALAKELLYYSPIKKP